MTRAHSLDVKLCDFIDHESLRFPTQLGVNWQSQRFRCCSFRLREITFFVSQIKEAFLQMKRDWIINLGPNFIASQMRSQFVSRLRSNNKLMVDVMVADAFPIGFGW